MKKNLALALLVIVLLCAGFGVRLHSEHFEDGSGTVTISYCLPPALCAEG